MSYSLTGDRPPAKTADDYSPQATLRCPGAVLVNLHVFNAGVAVQFGRGDPAAYDEPAFPQFPISPRSMARRVDAVRVKSLVAGQPATVAIEAFVAGELP